MKRAKWAAARFSGEFAVDEQVKRGEWLNNNKVNRPMVGWIVKSDKATSIRREVNGQ